MTWSGRAAAPGRGPSGQAVGSGQEGSSGRRPFIDPVSFTALAVAPALVAVILGWLGLRSGNAWLELLACAALGPLVVSYLARARLDWLEIRSWVPPRAVVGERVEHHLVVHNRGRGATPVTTLTHRIAGYTEVTVLVPALPPGGVAALRLPRIAMTRGSARFQDFVLATSAPLGLVERRRTIRRAVTTRVHPAPVPPVFLDPRAGEGDHPSGQAARTGHDVHATREWRPGDESRRVHWRSTARRGRLVVVEPERTVAHRLAILMVGDPLALSWEALIARAASTCVAAQRAGREVLLLARDPEAGSRITTDPVDALDWFAELGRVERPHSDDVRRCAEWAGPGGDVLLAGTGGTGPEWWLSGLGSFSAAPSGAGPSGAGVAGAGMAGAGVAGLGGIGLAGTGPAEAGPGADGGAGGGPGAGLLGTLWWGGARSAVRIARLGPGGGPPAWATMSERPSGFSWPPPGAVPAPGAGPGPARGWPAAVRGRTGPPDPRSGSGGPRPGSNPEVPR